MESNSEPIVPVGPTVVGLDPYQSLAPVLRAQVVVAKPAIVAQPVEEGDETAAEGGERDYQEYDPKAKLHAVPANIGDEEGVAIPVAQPLGGLGTEAPADPETGIELPAPKPIQFD